MSEEPLPPVAFYYGVQLSRTHGLPLDSPRRAFLEECFFRELVVIRLSSYLYHIQWSNRAVIQPEEVIDVLEKSGVLDMDLRLEWTPRQIIAHMRRARTAAFNPPELRCRVETQIYGLETTEYNWVDARPGTLGDLCPVKPNITHVFHDETKHPFPGLEAAIKKEKDPEVRNFGHESRRIHYPPHKQGTTAKYYPPGYELDEEPILQEDPALARKRTRDEVDRGFNRRTHDGNHGNHYGTGTYGNSGFVGREPYYGSGSRGGSSRGGGGYVYQTPPRNHGSQGYGFDDAPNTPLQDEEPARKRSRPSDAPDVSKDFEIDMLKKQIATLEGTIKGLNTANETLTATNTTLLGLIATLSNNK